MPNVTIDLKNLEEIKNTIIILQDMFNDERLPEELYIEYTEKFNKIWKWKKFKTGGFNNEWRSKNRWGIR